MKDSKVHAYSWDSQAAHYVRRDSYFFRFHIWFILQSLQYNCGYEGTHALPLLNPSVQFTKFSSLGPHQGTYYVKDSNQFTRLWFSMQQRAVCVALANVAFSDVFVSSCLCWLLSRRTSTARLVCQLFSNADTLIFPKCEVSNSDDHILRHQLCCNH